MGKKWGSIFIIIILIWSQFGVLVPKANIVEVDGFKVTEWNNTLTIMGFADGVSEVNLTIPSSLNNKTVGAIGGSAFRGLEIESLTIPSTIKIIGSWAFANNMITTLTIEDNTELETIGGSAFWENQLSHVEIPKSVKSIGSHAFYRNKLETVTFEAGSNLEIIEGEVFSNNQITSIEIPDSVKELKPGAFSRNKLTNLPFGENSMIKIIDRHAFSNNELVNVIIPSTVETINDYAFYSNKLESVEFSPSVQSIGEQAFAKNQLDIAIFSTPTSALTIHPTAFNDQLVKLAGPFNGWYEDPTFTIPWDFATTTILSSVTLYAKYGSGEVSPFNFVNNSDGTVTITGYKDATPEELVIPAEINGKPVKKIADNSFKEKGLVSVIFPSGIEEIGEAAFKTNQLTHIALPPTIKTVAAEAFSNNRLATVDIPEGIKELGDNAFALNKLSTVKIPSTLKVIGRVAFAENELTNVEISEGVETISFAAFHKNRLTTLTLPSSIIAIGGLAFQENALEQVEFKGAIPAVSNAAFSNQLLTPVFRDWYTDTNLQTLWDGTVSGAMKIYAKSPAVPSPFITVDNGDGTVKITGYSGTVPAALIIPAEINGKAVSVIGNAAFMFRDLTSVVIPDGIKKIETSAFSGNQLTDVVIPSTMQEIKSTAFKGNQLAQVEFKGAVSTIAESAFGDQNVTPAFTAWYTDRSMQPSALWNGTVPQAMTIYSTGLPSYLVTFNTNGGSNVAPKFVTQGEGMSAPVAPTRAGYTFAGWYKDSALQTAWNFATDKVAEATTLYAKWNAVLTPNPNPPIVTSPSDSTPTTNSNQIRVDVVDASNPNAVLVQTVITRETSNGIVKDTVSFTQANAREAIEKLAKQEKKQSRMVIPDTQQQVSETNIGIGKEAAQLLAINGMGLSIDMETVKFDVPATSFANINNDIYFRVVPVKTKTTQQQLEERARQQLQNSPTISLLGQPMTIETNMQNRPVTLMLPLPKEVTAQQLDSLVVYVEHSDGTKELVKGEIVNFKEGIKGIQFDVSKFSTFSVLYVEQKAEQVSAPYIQGYSDGTFRPNASITRAQMASMLARHLTNNEIPAVSASFKDTEKHGAKDAIEYVKAQGLFHGTTATTFNPNSSITRAQMAAIVVRWMEQQGSELEFGAPLSFTDVKASHWAAEAIAKVNILGIMTGTSETTFNPEGALTRAQAVKVLNQLFKREVRASEQAPLFTDVTPAHWAFDDIQAAAMK